MKEEFIEHKNNFNKLTNLLYNEFYFNGYCIKILGTHYMDYGFNWSVKTHKHTFFEFHYVIDGSCLTVINGIEKRINPGEFYLMPPNTSHSHRQETEEAHLGFCIRWELLKPSKASFGKSTKDMDLMLKSLSKFQWNKITDNGDIFNKFMDIVKSVADCSALTLQILFLEFLNCIQQFYINDDIDLPVRKEEGNCQNNGIAYSVIRFIDENYMLDISMQDIANHVFTSYSQLSRIFKKQNEITINHYLNKVRLSEAQKLLKCTNESISHITYKVGFSNEFYFSNTFKKFVGISPKEYRKKGMFLNE